MNELFSITNVAFTVFDYNMSWVELVSTVLALTAVILARLDNVWFYPFGILNSIGFIAIFQQVNLYSSLLLNVYFIVISFWGWWLWTRKGSDGNAALKVRFLSPLQHILMTVAIIVFTVLLATNIDIIYGFMAKLVGVEYSTPASPWTDAAATVMSVFAMYLLARRYMETWVLWVLVDIVCVYVYLKAGVNVLAFEYGIFLLNAVWGMYAWNKLSRENEEAALKEVKSERVSRRAEILKEYNRKALMLSYSEDDCCSELDVRVVSPHPSGIGSSPRRPTVKSSGISSMSLSNSMDMASASMSSSSGFSSGSSCSSSSSMSSSCDF